MGFSNQKDFVKYGYDDTTIIHLLMKSDQNAKIIL